MLWLIELDLPNTCIWTFWLWKNCQNLLNFEILPCSCVQKYFLYSNILIRPLIKILHSASNKPKYLSKYITFPKFKQPPFKKEVMRIHLVTSWRHEYFGVDKKNLTFVDYIFCVWFEINFFLRNMDKFEMKFFTHGQNEISDNLRAWKLTQVFSL